MSVDNSVSMGRPRAVTVVDRASPEAVTRPGQACVGDVRELQLGHSFCWLRSVVCYMGKVCKNFMWPSLKSTENYLKNNNIMVYISTETIFDPRHEPKFSQLWNVVDGRHIGPNYTSFYVHLLLKIFTNCFELLNEMTISRLFIAGQLW